MDGQEKDDGSVLMMISHHVLSMARHWTETGPEEKASEQGKDEAHSESSSINPHQN